MENNNLILILSAVAIILIIVLAAVAFSDIGKEKTQLTITSPTTLKNGDSLSLTLTDTSGKALANQNVEIILTDANGEENHQEVSTDTMENGALQLNGITQGQYNVEVIYTGDSHYSESEIQQSITVSDAVTVVSIASSDSSTSSDSPISEDGYSYKTGYGPDYDSQGVSREEAASKGWHYIPGTTDDGYDVGVYVPYDSKAGCYHC